MRIVMENAGLAGWAALSLLVFFLASLAILVWLYRPGSRDFYRKMGKMVEDGKSGKEGVHRDPPSPQDQARGTGAADSTGTTRKPSPPSNSDS
jgi:hypothetical protein